MHEAAHSVLSIHSVKPPVCIDTTNAASVFTHLTPPETAEDLCPKLDILPIIHPTEHLAQILASWMRYTSMCRRKQLRTMRQVVVETEMVRRQAVGKRPGYLDFQSGYCAHLQNMQAATHVNVHPTRPHHLAPLSQHHFVLGTQHQHTHHQLGNSLSDKGFIQNNYNDKLHPFLTNSRPFCMGVNEQQHFEFW